MKIVGMVLVASLYYFHPRRFNRHEDYQFLKQFFQSVIAMVFYKSSIWPNQFPNLTRRAINSRAERLSAETRTSQ